MTAVCGRWSDWEETYNDWLKHAVSGHSGGQALAIDTEAGEITTTLKLFDNQCIMYLPC